MKLLRPYFPLIKTGLFCLQVWHFKQSRDYKVSSVTTLGPEALAKRSDNHPDATRMFQKQAFKLAELFPKGNRS
jgi:hypothetical protein